MSLLQASALKKSYKGRTVVSDVSLQVETGQVVGLLGPNGAGKTTSFYMIVGLVPQDGGVVSVDDLDITTLPMHERARSGIGYLPQEASIFRRLTVEQNLMGVLEVRRDLTDEQRTDKMESLLEEFHIVHIRHT
ncbi:MAG: ATP-binding cassette domain-containing protein, partial [Aeromonadaceae bacterium]